MKVKLNMDAYDAWAKTKAGAVTNLPNLQESRPEIPRVEREREVNDESLPHLQEASLHDKANSGSECPQPLELTTWKTSRNGGNGRK